MLLGIDDGFEGLLNASDLLPLFVLEEEALNNFFVVAELEELNLDDVTSLTGRDLWVKYATSFFLRVVLEDVACLALQIVRVGPILHQTSIHECLLLLPVEALEHSVLDLEALGDHAHLHGWSTTIALFLEEVRQV